jgi:hypothetical protein
MRSDITLATPAPRGKLGQEAVERGETEMVPGQGEMERLQPGHQGREALGTQEWSYLYDCMTKASLIRPWRDLGHGGAGWLAEHAESCSC